jgi:uncharacterized membrane protein
MNTTLRIIQSLLALAFVGSGAMKLFAYETYKVMLDKHGPTGLTRGLITFIGIAELAGGVGIVLPMAINIVPWLSLWAAIGLSCTMLLAIRFHLRRHEPPFAAIILFLLAVLVVFARFSRWA